MMRPRLQQHPVRHQRVRCVNSANLPMRRGLGSGGWCVAARSSVLERLTYDRIAGKRAKDPTRTAHELVARRARPHRTSRPRLNSLSSQRDLTVTLITRTDAFELDDCTPVHAVTGRGAADTPGSSTQLTTAAVHTQAATNAPDQR